MRAQLTCAALETKHKGDLWKPFSAFSNQEISSGEEASKPPQLNRPLSAWIAFSTEAAIEEWQLPYFASAGNTEQWKLSYSAFQIARPPRSSRKLDIVLQCIEKYSIVKKADIAFERLARRPIASKKPVSSPGQVISGTGSDCLLLGTLPVTITIQAFKKDVLRLSRATGVSYSRGAL